MNKSNSLISFDNYFEQRRNRVFVERKGRFLMKNNSLKDDELFSEKSMNKWEEFLNCEVSGLNLKYSLDKFGQINFQYRCIDIVKGVDQHDLLGFINLSLTTLKRLNFMLRRDSHYLKKLDERHHAYQMLGEDVIKYIERIKCYNTLELYAKKIITCLKKIETENGIFIQFRRDIEGYVDYDPDGGIKDYEQISNPYLRVFEEDDSLTRFENFSLSDFIGRKNC